MTKRAVFNKVAKHLLTQNCKALGENNNCQYQGQNGTKCAIGCLIPDELYDWSMEVGFYEVIDKLEDKGAIKLVKCFKDNFDMLLNLQKVHDFTDVSEWRTELDKLAKKLKIIRPEY